MTKTGEPKEKPMHFDHIISYYVCLANKEYQLTFTNPKLHSQPRQDWYNNLCHIYHLLTATGTANQLTDTTNQ